MAISKKKYWSVAKAIKRAEALGIEVSRPTLVKWIQDHKLGFQLGKGGKWYIYKDKFRKFLNGGKFEENEGSEEEKVEAISQPNEKKSQEQQQEQQEK